MASETQTNGQAAPVESDGEHVRLKDIPTLDVSTLTLGEMSELERESGRSMESLLRGRATLLLVALWVTDRRNSSGKPRSWHELGNLRVFGKSS